VSTLTTTIPKLMSILCCFLLLLLVVGSTVGQDDDQRYWNLVEWIGFHGGWVEKGIATHVFAGNVRGMVALRDLEEDVELLHCPGRLMIPGSHSDSDDHCQVVKFLAREFQLGDQSSFRPYLDSMDLPRLPAFWDEATLQELQGLPPSGTTQRHEEWLLHKCGLAIKDHPALKKALTAFLSRSNAAGMIPFYDLFNHHNGLQNVKLFLTDQGASLRTTRPVSKGQQLYLSYGLRPASHMLRDYGFVDAWPTLWSWKLPESTHSFIVASFPDGVAAVDPSIDFLQAIWESPTPTLLQWQQNATYHTQSLPSSTLKLFVKAANHLLEGLPTSWREDQQILAASEQLNSGDDRVAAVQYRWAFKKAVADARFFAVAVLKERRTASVNKPR
jgi:SET domain